jgi:CDP-diacylglycerol--glycerol-3-phosphate 3-phosphatidyltransferase
MPQKREIDLQKMTDSLVNKAFLWVVPHSVKPNHVTLIRFLLVPIIYWLLASDMLALGLIVFAIAAITDAMDGAMARTRNQITDLGKVIDPIADKLLVLVALFYIGWDLLLIKIFVVYILFEMIAVLVGYFFTPYLGKPTGANLFGKIKLILQCFSVGFFIVGVIISNKAFIDIAQYVLFVALFFAVVAGMETARRRIKMFLADHNIKLTVG